MALHRCLYLAAWLGFRRPELPWTGDFRDDNFLVTHGLSVDSVTLIAHILLVLHIDRPLRHLLVTLILRHIDLNRRQVRGRLLVLALQRSAAIAAPQCLIERDVLRLAQAQSPLASHHVRIECRAIPELPWLGGL